MVRLICTDIDGTLLPEGGDKLPEEYFGVLRDLNQKGVQFVAASGRQYASIYQLLYPVRDLLIYAAEGGCLLMRQGQVLDAACLPWEETLALGLAIGKIPGCCALMSSPEWSYCLQGEEELFRKMKEEYHYAIKKVPNWEEISDETIIKISLFRREGNVEEVDPYIPQKWKNHPQITYACSGYQWYDFSDRRSNKGSAVEKIQNLLHINPSETVVFGDNKNDIPMFDKAAESYAVAGAPDEVKKAAGSVVKAMEEGGVLEKLIEIRKSLP